MKRRLAILILLAARAAWGQDSSFTILNVRGGLLRMPEIGHLADDWRAKTGLHVELASHVGPGELALAAGHVAFDPTTGKPSFTETLVSLGWTAPLARMSRASVEGGARITDVRMDFDDPSVVVGLRTEEEVLLSLVARARLAFGRGYGGFAEASYGALMLSTRTPTMTVVVGLERTGRMPAWVRDILR